MLKRIMNSEFTIMTEEPPRSNEILESNERMDELIKKLKSIDVDLFEELDNEIGKSISLNSRYYFNKGFEIGLQLANEIKDVKVK